MAAIVAVFYEVRAWNDDFVARFDGRSEEVHKRAGRTCRHHDILGGKFDFLLSGKIFRDGFPDGGNTGVRAIPETKRTDRIVGDFVKDLACRFRRRNVGIAERKITHGVFAVLSFKLKPLFEHLADKSAFRGGLYKIICYCLHSFIINEINGQAELSWNR